jgi:hypothetical protein
MLEDAGLASVCQRCAFTIYLREVTSVNMSIMIMGLFLHVRNDFDTLHIFAFPAYTKHFWVENRHEKPAIFPGYSMWMHVEPPLP